MAAALLTAIVASIAGLSMAIYLGLNAISNAALARHTASREAFLEDYRRRTTAVRAMYTEVMTRGGEEAG